MTDFLVGGELHSLIEDYGCFPEEVVRIYVGEIALAIGKFYSQLIRFGFSGFPIESKWLSNCRFSPQRRNHSQRYQSNERSPGLWGSRDSYRFWSCQMATSDSSDVNFLRYDWVHGAWDFEERILWTRSWLVVTWNFGLLRSHPSGLVLTLHFQIVFSDWVCKWTDESKFYVILFATPRFYLYRNWVEALIEILR